MLHKDTKNHYHMRYSSWDTEWNRHFWPFFIFTPKQFGKPKFWDNGKSLWRCHHFTNVFQKWRLWCMLHGYGVWQTVFLSFWAIFCTFTPLRICKTKFWKNEKNACRCYDFTYVYHKWHHIMYGSWDIKHNGQNFLSFCTIFTLLSH